MFENIIVLFRKNWKLIGITLLVLISLNAILISLYKLPAFFEVFELSKDSDNNISTSVSNFISPILNCLTIVLVYAAYVKQVEANRNDRESNNMQFCLSLFETINHDIENIHFSKRSNSESKVFTGYRAITEITNLYVNGIFKNVPFSYFNYARTLMSLYYSFTTIKEWINTAEISDNNRSFLNKKLENFYYCWLAIDFYQLKQSFDKYPKMVDHSANLIISLVNEYDPDLVEKWMEDFLNGNTQDNAV